MKPSIEGHKYITEQVIEMIDDITELHGSEILVLHVGIQFQDGHNMDFNVHPDSE